MQIQAIHFSPFKASGQKMFGSTPMVEWQRYVSMNDDGTCDWALRSLLISEGENHVLIDTGFAAGFPNIIDEYKITDFKSASEVFSFNGINPDSITHVVHTHLHLDHCGGSFQKDEKSFKAFFNNAVYYVSKQNIDTALNPEEIEKDSYQPEIVTAFCENGNKCLVENESYVFPWLELLFFNGHTKGLILPVIHTQKQSIAFVGDLIPSAAHIILNSASAYDMNPLLCLAEREEFLDEAFENEYLLFFQHDSTYECCSLKKENSRVVPAEFFAIENISI